MFRNNTTEERFYDLLDNQHLWREFVEVSHDTVFQERMVLYHDFSELLLYMYQGKRKIEKDFLKFGGLDYKRYEEFMEFVTINPPNDFSEEE